LKPEIKNIGKGLIAAIFNWIFKVSIPLIIFTSLAGYDLFGIVLFSEIKVQIITYWIWGMGIITTSINFWVASSPKFSIRKAIAEIILLIANLFYMYIYRFSGIMEFENLTISLSEKLSTTFSMNLNNLIYASMGVMGLNIFVYLYDLLIAIFSPIEPKSKNHKQKSNSKRSKSRKRNYTMQSKKTSSSTKVKQADVQKFEYKSVFGDDT